MTLMLLDYSNSFKSPQISLRSAHATAGQSKFKSDPGSQSRGFLTPIPLTGDNRPAVAIFGFVGSGTEDIMTAKRKNAKLERDPIEGRKSHE